MEKVKFINGNNIDNEYYIVALKKEVEIDKKTLSFKIENSNETIRIINENSFKSNFDFIISEYNKKTKKRKFIPCLKDEIEF